MNKTKVAITVILSMGVMFIAGCEKKEPAAANTAPVVATPKVNVPVDAAKTVAAAVEQKMCPIMGKAIDKTISTEYKGKKVYFCCPGCIDTFKKEPEKYLAKLPQFKSE